MAGTTLTATIVGVDKASSVLGKVGDKATETGGKFKAGAALAGGALAGIGIAGFFTDSIKAFTDAQAQTQKLEDAFGKFPALGDTTAAAIEKVSSALEAKTKFDDDETNGAAAVLAQFDLTGQQITTLLPLLQDYAVATGKDLPTAATDLGKAFEGQTKALKAVGINYKSTGDKATDFTNITSLLSQKVGGFAENEGKTAAGQLEILKNQFGEVEETVGSALVPALVGLGHVVIPVLEDLGTAVKGVVTFVEALPGPVQAGVLAFAGYKLLSSTSVFQKITSGIADMKLKIAEATVATDENSVAMTKWQATTGVVKSGIGSLASSLAAPAGIMAATIVVSDIVSSFNAWDTAAGAVKSSVSDLTTQLVADGGKWTDATEKQFEASVAQSEVFQDLTKNGADYSTTMKFLTGQTLTTADNTDSLKSAMGDLSPVLLQQALQMQGVKDQSTDGAAALLKYQAAQDTTTTSVGAGAGAFRQAEEASDAAYTKMQDIAKLAKGELPGALQDSAGAWHAMGTSVPVSAIAAIHDGLSNAQEVAIAINGVLPYNAKNWKGIGAAAGVATTSVDLFSAAMDKLTGRNGDAAAAARANEAAIRAVGSAFRDQQAAADNVTQSEIDLKAAQEKKITSDYTAQQKALDVAAATRQVKDAQDGAKDSADKLAEAQDGMAQSADTAVLAVYNSKLKTDGYKSAVAAATTKMGEERTAFIQQATQAGLSATAAGKLADKLGLIPANVKTVIAANTSQAIIDVDKLKTSVDKLPSKKTITIYTNQINSGGKANSGTGYSVGLATGGAVTGPGMKGVDSQVRILAPGEHVLSDSDVDAMGGQSAVYAFRQSLHHGARGPSRGSGYARTGRIMPMPGGLSGHMTVVNVSIPNGVYGQVNALVKPLVDAVNQEVRLGNIRAGSFA